MKINDYLIFCRTIFFHMDDKASPFNVKEIQVALSLKSFNFPQILSKFSENTHKWKSIVLHKWKSILLLKGKARNICGCFYSMGTVCASSKPTEYQTMIEINLGCQCFQYYKQVDENTGKNWALEIMPVQGHISSLSPGKSDRLLLKFEWY